MQGSEHHFVPQFYLRAFSLDGRSVSCFNFARERWVKQASIKHQCARHNFHAFAPRLEKQLSILEARAASTMRIIREHRTLPLLDSQHWEWLLTYLIYQKCRTPRATQMLTKMTDYFRETLGEAAPPAGELVDEHPVAVTLKVAGDILPVARDLEMHLVCNDTATEFITSDDPVVVHNQFCEGVKHTGTLGWNCRGFQAFLPLSPKELLVLFDTAVYRVGESHKGVRTTHARSEHDIEIFNALQILNADENAYFANTRGDGKAAQQCWALAKRRQPNRLTIIETERVKETDSRDSAIIGHFEGLLPIHLETSVISVQKRAKQIPLDQRARMYRNLRPSPNAAPPPPRSRRETVRYPVKSVSRR